VVLFNCSGCGVVVVPTSKAAGSVVGHFSKAWNMENFTLYTGEVTLKNG
jgi:hypothetical protein